LEVDDVLLAAPERDQPLVPDRVEGQAVLLEGLERDAPAPLLQVPVRVVGGRVEALAVPPGEEGRDVHRLAAHLALVLAVLDLHGELPLPPAERAFLGDRLAGPVRGLEGDSQGFKHAGEFARYTGGVGHVRSPVG
jgi:hypothetical protein